jgi:hypothetical protein
MDWRAMLDRPASRAVRGAALGLGLVGLGLATARLLVPLTVHLFVRAIEQLMNGCVWLAMSLSTGASLSAMVGTIGRHVGDVLRTRQASLGLTLMTAVVAIAAYALQRLIGSDEESPR